jgi:ribonucrease Y
MIDSRSMSDAKALDLSQKIAAKIEEECNYPGQIKVVVVRETVSSEMTRAGA